MHREKFIRSNNLCYMHDHELALIPIVGKFNPISELQRSGNFKFLCHFGKESHDAYNNKLNS